MHLIPQTRTRCERSVALARTRKEIALITFRLSRARWLPISSAGDTWRLRWGVNWGFVFNCRLLVLLHCGCWWIDSDGVKVRLGVDGEDAKVCLGIDSDGAEVS